MGVNHGCPEAITAWSCARGKLHVIDVFGSVSNPASSPTLRGSDPRPGGLRCGPTIELIQLVLVKSFDARLEALGHLTPRWLGDLPTFSSYCYEFVDELALIWP